MGEDWSKTERSKSLPDLVDLIEESRRQRAGPPLDPWAAAYPHTLALARDVLWREIKDEDRREVVLKEFEARVARIEEALKDCNSLGEQILALDQVLGDANFLGLDLREHRESRGPDDDEDLLDEYEPIASRVRAIFGRRAGWDRAQVAQRLQIAYPHLTSKQAARATFDRPSWVALTVLGARYALSPSRVRNRLTEARRRRASDKRGS